MNTFIRVPRNLIKCGYDSQLYRKHYSVHHRSYFTHKYRTDGKPFYFNRFSVDSHPVQLARYSSLTNTTIRNDTTSNRYEPLHSYTSVRAFRLSNHLLDSASSKVETTVQRMKDKQKEKVEKIMKEAASAASSTSTGLSGDKDTSAPMTVEAEKSAVVKKSLKARFWNELVHYYHGFRLLFIDINVCRKLLMRVLNGYTLSRRENKQLVRTTSDLFRLIPFAVFLIVPFMEFLLPFFIKFFPGMLPSTFQTDKEREHKLKQSLQVKLEMAKFLQQTLDEMAPQHKKGHNSEDAKLFDVFFQKIKNPNEYVPNDEIIRFAKLFEDEITLNSLTRVQLGALCRLLELNTMGTTSFLRFQLRLKLRSLAADDHVISREGVNGLDLFELQQACKSRGMRAYGLTAERLRSQLQEWIDLSLNEKVPPILLLLSRALLISDDTMTADKLKETIRVLPDAIAAQTKAAIGESEGMVDNKTKIEVIKHEERIINEEREEEREERAKEEIREERAKEEILLDKAPVIETTDIPIKYGPVAPMQTAAQHADFSRTIDPPVTGEQSLSSKDVELLSTALKSLSSDKKLVVEKETIKDIKEELQEYKEDVEELREVRSVVKEPVHESRAAKMLFKKVNRMMGQLDKVVDDLEKKQKNIQKTVEKVDDKAIQTDLVKVEDLLTTIKMLKQTSDESRLKQIEYVLSKIDTDKDGVITVDEVLKVVEAIGRENVKLNENQLEDLINLLEKEQVFETEQKIEKALAKSIKQQQKLEEQNKIDLSRAAAEELKDCAQTLEDKATDLDLEDQKRTFKADKPTLGTTTEGALLEAAEKQAEKIIPKADITAAIPTTIPPPTTVPQVNQKDKML